MKNHTVHKGLEGIYVDETSISDVDGEIGRLIYRDHSIESLVNREFLEVAFLVIFARFPQPSERQNLAEFLSENADLTDTEVAILKTIPSSVHPMRVLQGMIPLLSTLAKRDRGFGDEATRGLVLVAKVPALISGLFRHRQGRPIMSHQVGLSYHQSFLHRMFGRLPEAKMVSVLDTTQILQMEHGFNASTFAARVTASTLAPVECAISAAVGTLFGPLHGGADQAALEMGLAIGGPEKAEAYVIDTLSRQQKIMGMGHRVYRVTDPRAAILKPLARELCVGTPFENLFLTLERVEDVMAREMRKSGKQIKANVEFYKGPVFYAMGIPPEYFTTLFAMSRVFGYLAHILESRQNNRLIRPQALYLRNGASALQT